MKITSKKLIQILAKLPFANLAWANLAWADLSDADLSKANLSGADLSKANLSGAKLPWANLSGADLSDADLSRANLSEANLLGANLSGADLYEANLSKANLHEANLTNIRNLIYNICPEGTIIGWKKMNDHIIQLQIDKKYKRLNSIGSRKCRAEAAKVLEIVNLKSKEKVNSVIGGHDSNFKYQVGKLIKPDAFNDDISIECTNGIHFFITKEEAENY